MCASTPPLSSLCRRRWAWACRASGLAAWATRTSSAAGGGARGGGACVWSSPYSSSPSELPPAFTSPVSASVYVVFSPYFSFLTCAILLSTVLFLPFFMFVFRIYFVISLLFVSLTNESSIFFIFLFFLSYV